MRRWIEFPNARRIWILCDVLPWHAADNSLLNHVQDFTGARKVLEMILDNVPFRAVAILGIVVYEQQRLPAALALLGVGEYVLLDAGELVLLNEGEAALRVRTTVITKLVAKRV